MESAMTPKLEIQRLYIKECSYKIPHAPDIFTDGSQQPLASFELRVKLDTLPGNGYEIVLQAHVTTKLKERTALILDIQQAGIFKCENFTPEQLDRVLKSYCPTVLHPYLCRAIADVTVQAGFPALLLAPMNFEQLYQQQQSSEVSVKDTPLN